MSFALSDQNLRVRKAVPGLAASAYSEAAS